MSVAFGKVVPILNLQKEPLGWKITQLQRAESSTRTACDWRWEFKDQVTLPAVIFFCTDAANQGANVDVKH